MSQEQPPICWEVTEICTVEWSIYGYYPNLPVNAILCAAFAICLILQGYQTWRYKTWSYGIAMCLGCFAEVIGYVGRILLHNNPFSSIGFQIQICTLIIAPAFFSGAIYLTLKHICIALGPQLSLVRPHLYTWIFIACDLLSLILQGTGGGIAATAGANFPLRDQGTNVMIAGIVWQVITLFVFGGLASHIFWRLMGDGGKRMSSEAQEVWAGGKLKVFILSLAVAFTMIFFRCVYRIAEMAGGWANEIMRDEISFVILEGVVCLVAAILLTIIHPGSHFPQMRTNYTKPTPLHNTSEDTSDVEMKPRMETRN
ncbi:hypothetical protein FQN53_000526 [Emmonsiellopsis sp. PD_33]|nr:hypothetical protein FQN53_000526 [Emmonsiellopsis sp. PD_33]